MSEWMDVTDLLAAFEKHNEVVLQVSMSPQSTPKGPDLAVMVTATYRSRKNPEVSVSDSVSVRCSALNLKSLASVVTHALYALDFQLALNEWGVDGKPKA
jgi:hypothetical protein